MTRWAVLATLYVAGTAYAQPVTRPCHVTVALAPDDVRAEIDAWVRAEPRCERELEVRVVPTDDGLYLQARDGTGHVRERVVPDAQSAAVLVVSWMADDSLGTSFPTALEAPSITLGAIDTEVPPGIHDSVYASAPPRDRTTARRLVLGALASRSGGGLRGQLDLFGGRHWSAGIGGGGRAVRGAHDGLLEARVTLAATHAIGRVALRFQLGLGVDLARPEHRMQDAFMETSDREGNANVSARIEAGAFATFDLGRGWGLVGGPLVSAGRHGPVARSLFFGVQRGL